ncbi:MAG: A24 family peptidase [Planctomycetota bacterium]|nr:A24 family peptidase [Planctomycetota bacterium]
MENTTVLWCSMSLVVGAVAGSAIAKWILCLDGQQPFLPRLKCIGCGESFRAWRRLPVVGYFAARGRCQCGHRLDSSIPVVEVVTMTLFAAFTLAYLKFGCQTVAEVRPDWQWYYGRLVFHLILIGLLIVATGTDLRDYFIPDQVTMSGTVLALVAAFGTGDFQMMHVWIDWSHEVPGLNGPYIPDWIKHHRHLHGLANSLAGAVLGGGSIWLLGRLTKIVLGEYSVGVGDATLMLMVGAFVGWQPVVFVLCLAPLCAIAVGLLVWMVVGRPYISFGPYLSIATLIVLFSWTALWVPNRLIFSHWPTMLGLALGTLTVLLLLLLGLRGYRSIPARRV